MSGGEVVRFAEVVSGVLRGEGREEMLREGRMRGSNIVEWVVYAIRGNASGSLWVC